MINLLDAAHLVFGYRYSLDAFRIQHIQCPCALSSIDGVIDDGRPFDRTVISGTSHSADLQLRLLPHSLDRLTANLESH